MLSALLALLGLLLGSFVGVVAARGPAVWGLVEAGPASEGFVTGRSVCAACGVRLAWFDLVPLLSFAALRGRCRRCGAPIPRRDLAVEASGGLIGLLCALAFLPNVAAALAAMAFLLLLLGAAAIDAETGFLPDAMVLPALWGALLTSIAGLSSAPPGAAILGAAMGYGALRIVADGYALLRRREGLGRGDAKLLAAAGAWLGPLALPFVLLTASLAGLLAVALRPGRPQGDDALRFGPYLAAGTALLVLIDGVLPGRVVPAWPGP